MYGAVGLRARIELLALWRADNDRLALCERGSKLRILPERFASTGCVDRDSSSPEHQIFYKALCDSTGNTGQRRVEVVDATR